MNPYAIPPLAALVLTAALGAYVFCSNPRSRLNRYLALYMLCVTVWLSGFVLMYASTDAASALAYARIGFLGIAIVPPAILHFVLIFLGREHSPKLRHLLRVAYASAVLGVATSQSPLVYRGVYTGFWGYYPLAGWLYPVFLTAFAACFVTASVILFTAMRAETNAERVNQIRYLLCAQVCATPALVDYLDKFQLGVYPFGYICALIWALWMAWAIVSTDLLDIRIAVTRSTIALGVYVICLGGPYALAIWARDGLEAEFAELWWLAPLGASTVLATVGPFIYRRAGAMAEEALARHIGIKELATLAEERDNAIEASLAKSYFLASMSHELRTPLNAIIGYSELIEEEATDQGAGTEAYSDAQKIKTAARHLLGLINQILDISQIEAGRMQLNPQAFELRALIDTVAITIEPVVSEKSNKLELDIAPGAPRLFADADKLEQMLVNLVGNAAKFTEHGTITLRARWMETTENGQRLLELAVRDTGIGMSEAQQRWILEPFRQADAETQRKYGGTGLGLTIVANLCKLMGGKLSVASQQGEGSTFTIRVPCRSAGDDDR